jgi:hypothetical protein
MNETKHRCPHCNQVVTPSSTGSDTLCPACGQAFRFASMTSGNDGAIQPKMSGLQLVGIWLLVLLAFFLVGLAFLFAQCAQGLKNI